MKAPSIGDAGRVRAWPWTAKVLVLALASAWFMAPSAHAAETGGISGTVISAATKAAIGGIEVCAYEGIAPYAATCQKTSGTGEYTIGGLAPGSYAVSFFAPVGSSLNYIAQNHGSSVSVTNGAMSRNSPPPPRTHLSPATPKRHRVTTQ